MLEKLNWFCLAGLVTLVLLIQKWMGLFLRKNQLLRCWGWIFLLSWIGALTLPLFLKLPSRKLEPWFVLWCFLPRRLYCISINLPYEHAWNTVVMSELALLVATLNCRIGYKKGMQTVGPSLAAPLDSLTHRRNVTSLSLFYKYYFGRCWSELAQLIPFPYSWGKSSCNSMLVAVQSCMECIPINKNM